MKRKELKNFRYKADVMHSSNPELDCTQTGAEAGHSAQEVKQRIVDDIRARIGDCAVRIWTKEE